MKKTQVHVRLDDENYNHLVMLSEKNNQTLSDVIRQLIIEDRKYADLKKSLRWTNDMLEIVYEMTNYLALEVEVRAGERFLPRLTKDHKSDIIRRIEAIRKQERGFDYGRDRNQE